jgi:ribonuclease VapC
MIVDSSAMVAVIKREPDWETLATSMDAAETLSISAASYLETALVVDSLRNPVQSAKLDDLLLDLEMAVEPVTVEQARIARQAYRDYGKGSGHRANLNFGDCFSYALARVKREPLLYKGDDFVHTDVRSAI